LNIVFVVSSAEFGVQCAVSVGGFIDKGRGSYGDAFTSWFEAVFSGTVFYHPDFSGVVDVAVFSFHFSGREFGFDFE
jgi:hypothetical protein